MVAMHSSEFGDAKLAAFLEEQTCLLEDYAQRCGSVGASLPVGPRRRDWESRADALLRRAGLCRETLRSRGFDDPSAY